RRRDTVDWPGPARLPGAFAQRKFSVGEFRSGNPDESSRSARTGRVKRKLRFLVIALTVATGAASLLAQEEKKETLSDKLKKLFGHPTPTSTPRKKHKGAGASPTVSPTETPISSASPPPPESATVVPSPSETTVPATTVTPTETRSPAETQYF